ESAPATCRIDRHVESPPLAASSIATSLALSWPSSVNLNSPNGIVNARIPSPRNHWTSYNFLRFHIRNEKKSLLNAYPKVDSPRRTVFCLVLITPQHP